METLFFFAMFRIRSCNASGSIRLIVRMMCPP